MSVQTSIENIVRECIAAIGADAVLEIVNKSKAVVVTPTEETSKKPETENKRITRISPTIATQLKTELSKVGVNVSEDDKKEFDKIKKEFTAYVNKLEDKEFSSKGLADHMRDFANTKKPATEEKVVETKKIDEKPKKGKKADTKVTVQKAEEQIVPVPKEFPSNTTSCANVAILSIAELQKLEYIVTPSDKVPVGVLWDGQSGRWVTGPETPDDEDFVETEFQGTTYMVGEKSGRVYVSPEDDGYDVFHGFVGVGKFHDMKKSNA